MITTADYGQSIQISESCIAEASEVPPVTFHKLSQNMREVSDRLAYQAFKNGTSVRFAKGLEDWEGGEDFIICPNSDATQDKCKGCLCANVHTVAECAQWINMWGDHKQMQDCPGCEVLDIFKAEEFEVPDDFVFGDLLTNQLEKTK